MPYYRNRWSKKFISYEDFIKLPVTLRDRSWVILPDDYSFPDGDKPNIEPSDKDKKEKDGDSTK